VLMLATAGELPISKVGGACQLGTTAIAVPGWQAPISEWGGWGVKNCWETHPLDQTTAWPDRQAGRLHPTQPARQHLKPHWLSSSVLSFCVLCSVFLVMWGKGLRDAQCPLALSPSVGFGTAPLGPLPFPPLGIWVRGSGGGKQTPLRFGAGKCVVRVGLGSHRQKHRTKKERLAWAPSDTPHPLTLPSQASEELLIKCKASVLLFRSKEIIMDRSREGATRLE